MICEAVNEYGRASSEAMLVVLPRGEPPDFIEWLSNIKARPGSQVTHKVSDVKLKKSERIYC